MRTLPWAHIWYAHINIFNYFCPWVKCLLKWFIILHAFILFIFHLSLLLNWVLLPIVYWIPINTRVNSVTHIPRELLILSLIKTLFTWTFGVIDSAPANDWRIISKRYNLIFGQASNGCSSWQMQRFHGRWIIIFSIAILV